MKFASRFIALARAPLGSIHTSLRDAYQSQLRCSMLLGLFVWCKRFMKSNIAWAFEIHKAGAATTPLTLGIAQFSSKLLKTFNLNS